MRKGIRTSAALFLTAAAAWIAAGGAERDHRFAVRAQPAAEGCDGPAMVRLTVELIRFDVAGAAAPDYAKVFGEAGGPPGAPHVPTPAGAGGLLAALSAAGISAVPVGRGELEMPSEAAYMAEASGSRTFPVVHTEVRGEQSFRTIRFEKAGWSLHVTGDDDRRDCFVMFVKFSEPLAPGSAEELVLAEHQMKGMASVPDGRTALFTFASPAAEAGQRTFWLFAVSRRDHAIPR